MTQQLIRVGDRIVDLNAVTHATFDPEAVDLYGGNPHHECTLSFGCDEIQVFHEGEADVVWKLLSDRASNLTPLPEMAGIGGKAA